MKPIVVLLAAGVSACAPSLAATGRFAKVRIRDEPVSGPIHALFGAGGNIGVSAGPDGILIVDDQFAPLAERIRAALRHLGTGRLKYVLNTHWHGDHTGGNAIFGTKVPILAHTNVRKRLSTPQRMFGGRLRPALPKAAWPVITFDHSLSVHFNGEEIKMIHFPAGHTDTDSVIFFTGSNVVHMGDHFFVGRFPYVDLEHGGDALGLARNVGAVLKRLPPGVKIIPGHGPVSDIAALRAYHRMLVETIRIIRERVAAGAKLEALQKQGLPAEWARWGKGFVNTRRWIATVYRSLTRPQPGR